MGMEQHPNSKGKRFQQSGNNHGGVQLLELVANEIIWRPGLMCKKPGLTCVLEDLFCFRRYRVPMAEGRPCRAWEGQETGHLLSRNLWQNWIVGGLRRVSDHDTGLGVSVSSNGILQDRSCHTLDRTDNFDFLPILPTPKFSNLLGA